MMTSSKLNVVPLAHASLCLDCEVITAAHASCPACGSGALMSISRALSQSEGREALYSSARRVASVPPGHRRSEDGGIVPGMRAPV